MAYKKTYNPCDDCQYSFSKNNQESNMCKICEFRQLLDKPTADVVEVVRCKDCKKRYTKNCSLCYDTANKGYFLWSMINDNFFCAYGERKCDND